MISETLRVDTFISYLEPVNQDPDTTRQLDNQLLRMHSWILPSFYQNPSDPTRQLDTQGIKIHTYLTYTQETAEIKNKTTSWNLDAEGNVAMTSASIYDFVLTKANNPTDSTLPLNNQKLKIFSFNQLIIDNPPWVWGDVTIKPSLYARWEQHKLGIQKLNIKTSLGGYRYFVLPIQNANIKDTYSAQNWQFVNNYAEKLSLTTNLRVTSELHQVREAMTMSDSYSAIQVVPFKSRMRIRARFNKVENIQYADYAQKMKAYPRLTADVTWGETENSLLTISDTLKVHSEQVKIRERFYGVFFHGQFETIPYRQKGKFTTEFSETTRNPIYVNYSDRGQWRTTFDTFVIDPPSKIFETLNITDTWTSTATNPSTPDVPEPVVPDTPDTGGGTTSYADAQEDLQHFIYISPSFHTSETVSLREVLAIATWANHTPHSNALLREGLTIRFTENSERHNPNKIEASLVIKDFLKISTKQLANLLEYVRISDHYYTKGGSSDEATITYVVNEGNETTRYEHWPFESYAAFKGMYLGCCADGVYVLSGDNDDGEPIEAMINFGKQSFGSANYKRVPYVYASLAGDGDVYLQVSYNEDEQYMYPARKVDEYNATARFDLGRGIKANYLTFELYNENGSKFDLRNLWIYLTELSRRI